MVDEWVQHLIATLIVGLCSGGLGSYIGIRLALGRLEMRLDIIEPLVDRNEHDLRFHGEDLMAHDMELSMALDKLDIKRVSRQIFRRER